MIKIIKVSGFENEDVEKLTLMEEKSGLLGVSSFIFNKVVDGERENVLMRLMGRFKSLRYEDLEEVYNDGCLVLWDKMMDKEFNLKEKSMVGYLGYEVREDDGRGIEEIFDVMDERGNEDERYEKLDRIWSKLKEVDRMILESYYVDGCRMEEIAKRIGYKNGNSVKSKKKKVLMKIMEMRDRADFKDLPAAA